MENEFLKKCASRGISLGLDTMYALMAGLGNPQDKIKTIHITGTNGKGSTGAFLEGILRMRGCNVARYTSPAVFSDMEKYTINSIPITEEEFNLCTQEVAKVCFDGINPTLFEAETAIAFLYFAKMNCDYAIIEVGMGGREDATNVIKAPSCSIITPIAKDHMSFLGNSVELIAKEKCGIIKKDCPVVSARQTEGVKNIIDDSAKEKNAHLSYAKETTYIGFDGQMQHFVYDEDEFELSALGTYQPQNAALAIEAAKAVEDFTLQEIKDGMKNVIWQGRFEVISQNPTFVIDGAHNESGAIALCDSIKKYYQGKEINFITATFADKEYEKTTALLAPLAKRIFAVDTNNPRGLDAQAYAKSIQIHNASTYKSTVSESVRECIKDKDAVTICFGTLSFLAQIKAEVEKLDGKS